MVVLALPHDELVASHLPLYSPPHDYQILYKIEIPQDTINQLKDLELVTFLPEKFDLQTLIDGKQITLKGTFYKGHFERGGKAITTTSVKFSKQIFKRKLPIYSRQSKPSRFEIINLEKGTQIALHHIQPKPSMDAIVQLTPAVNSAKSEMFCLNTLNINNAHDVIKQALEKCLQGKTLYLETKDFQ